jgi:hypothetical protein
MAQGGHECHVGVKYSLTVRKTTDSEHFRKSHYGELMSKNGSREGLEKTAHQGLLNLYSSFNL